MSTSTPAIDSVAAPQKPVASWVAMAKIESTTMCGLTIPLAWWQFCLIAFICGYCDAYSFLNYAIFTTMMSGNGVLFIVAMREGEWAQGSSLAGIIGCFAIVGLFLNFSLLQYFKCWQKAYGPTLVLIFFAAILFEVLHANVAHIKYISLCILVSAVGNMCYWTTKCGALLMLHTGNLLKIFEFIFLYLFGYDVGDAKSKGALLCLALYVFCFGMGGFFAVNRINRDYKLMPMTVALFILIAYEYQDLYYIRRIFAYCCGMSTTRGSQATTEGVEMDRMAAGSNPIIGNRPERFNKPAVNFA